MSNEQGRDLGQGGSLGIESVSREDRVFDPPVGFSEAARVGSMADYEAEYGRSLSDPEGFWLGQASALHWYRKPTKAQGKGFPHATWFEDGVTNVSYNALDRHVASGAGERCAILWEGEDGAVRRISYRELMEDVGRCAGALSALGVKAGDRVAVYMGMVPEAVITMLACARMGAVHTVIFGGFAPEAIADRVQDAGVKAIVTQDGAWRRGSVVPLKANVDRALEREGTDSVEKVLVLRRAGNDIEMVPGRDVQWSQAVQGAAPIESVPLDAEHPLFVLYTSGTTGKPKGVLHTTGGYMVGTWLTTRTVFDVRPDDVYWCTADVGWVTGHSYLTYGPLLNGTTVFMYEGAPNHPGPNSSGADDCGKGRFWEMVARHRVTTLYTAPTAIRAFMAWGDEHVTRHDLSSLRLLGTVGEPINPEAWMWYRRVIGGDRCPVVDTWWQTETGAIMMSPLPGATPTKPGSCTLPLFGVEPDVLQEDGTQVPPGGGGLLVVRRPWPSMARTVWGDDARFRETYFSRFDGLYFTGDGARRDRDGYFWVMGRVDDVVNVAGHRLGTAEIESALVAHPTVAEAAVVGKPDPIKGQALEAFVTLLQGAEVAVETLRDWVAQEIGKFARPDAVHVVRGLPKTRSGKIMRRLLRDIAAGKIVGDVTTLEDNAVLDELRHTYDE